ncbi:MAG: molybdenum cofactor biosynthesis protein MoaE [Pseudomonadota bacterium]|nr:molybdenum cofactor biosynthesis protein MoaE [Pseudomonadota bacterium]
MGVTTRLERQAFDPGRELAELIAAAHGDGAVVSFVGLARPTARDGTSVEELVLEHHPHLTEQSLREIAGQAIERFRVTHVYVVHRCGSVAPGDPIVFAAAASPHRRAAFEAADYLMDRLKTDAVFWKREVGKDGSEWIEPTEDDVAARALWDR